MCGNLLKAYWAVKKIYQPTGYYLFSWHFFFIKVHSFCYNFKQRENAFVILTVLNE